MLKRTLANKATPTLDVSIDGDKYTIKSLSTIKNTEITFTLGQEFEETRADDKVVKTVVNLEGDNKLVQVQQGDKPVTIVREFTGDSVIITATVGSVTSVRTYKRL